MKLLKNIKSRNGFSLVEMLIVLAVGALLVFTISSFSGNLNVLKNIVGQKLQSRSDVDQTLQMMTTEIRSAGPSSLGAYAIESASTSSFVFYTDSNKDGLFDRVRYFLGTSTIQKGIVAPTGNPLTYVTSTEAVTSIINNVTLPSSSVPIFNYYDSAYTGTQAPLASPIDITKIRMVKISLFVDISTSTAPKPEFFTGTIHIRNLKSN